MHIDDFGADRSAESRSANAAQARWQQQGVLDLAPSLIHSDEPGEPVLPGRVLELQGVQVAMLNHGPIQVRRPTSLIRQFDPEAYNINLFLAGDGGLSQAGRQAAMTAGQFVVLDTSRPYEGWRRCDRASAPHSTLTLQIPRLMMPLPSNVADRLTAIAFDTRHGMGAVFARWVTGLVRDPGYFTHDDVSTLASVTTTLLAAALAPHANSALHDSSEARRRRLRFQIDDFIQRNLADPALGAEAVAAAAQISVRQLYELFAEYDRTPAAWIRHLRLERCRRDLADPRLRGYPVHTIAARWGFTDPTTFSRAFRAAYGVPPGYYRRLSHRES
ncbi:AraC family transcriptional regulator [Nonomuraea sp. NPDC049655]|uniref:AraC family transcriptional regulator n=1 Tax=Nonomuraea sp. NPDC049655 TaxID=3364355 RepID=UPI0037A96FD2